MNFIVAVSKDYAIGKNNDLLFNLPTDMKFFREATLNKVIIMGEKTYLSLPKRPLPKRINIVLSDNEKFYDENIIIVRNLDQLFEEIKKYPKDDVMVCGGASVYNLLMNYCEKAYITKVDKSVEADTFINNIENMQNWKLIDSSETFEENNLKFKFCTFFNKNIKEYKKTTV